MRSTRRGLIRYITILALLLGSLGATGMTGCGDESTAEGKKLDVSISKATPLRGHAPMEIDLEVTVFDAESEVTATWNFGDGTTRRDAPTQLRYTYDTPGVFELRVNIEDEQGGSGEDFRTVEVLPTTDLSVTSFQAQPLDLRTGEKINLQFNVSNDAGAVEVPFELVVFISEVSNPKLNDVNEYIVLYSQTLDTFPAKGEDGASEDYSLQLDIPGNLPNGEYTIGVAVDAQQTVGEIDESNNIIANKSSINIENLLTNGPDLLLTQVSVNPKSTRLLSSITVDTTLRNQGLRSVAKFSYAIFLSEDESFDDTEDIFLIERDVPGLSTGDTFTDSIIVTVNPVIETPGEYFIFVIVDPRGEVIELDETNNLRISANPIIVTDEEIQDSDIVVTEFLIDPTNTFLGGSFLASITMKNLGEQPTGSFVCTIYFSDDQALDLDGDTPVGSANIFGLGAQGEMTREQPISIPPFIDPGSYWAFVFCDSSGVVVEFDENNNAQRFPEQITVVEESEVDLFIENLTIAPESPLTNDTTVAVSFDLCNNGTTGASPSITRIYLSSDEIADPADRILFEALVPGINPESCQSFQSIVDISCDPWITDYQLLVQVDVRDSLQEDNEDNNTGVLDGGLSINGERCVCVNDLDNEPNNFSSLSTPLAEGDNLGFALCQGDSADWFKVNLQAGDSVRATLSHDPSFGPLDVLLYDPGKALLESNTGADPLAVVDAYIVPVPGDYYVQVLSGEIDAQNYYDINIEILSSAAGQPDLSAVDVALSTHNPQLNIPVFASGALVNLSDTAANPSTPIVVTLYLTQDRVADPSDSADIELYSFAIDSIGALERIEFGEWITFPGDVPGGDWYVAAYADRTNVVSNEADETNNATLSSPVHLDNGCYDPFEPNESISDATTIVPQLSDPAATPNESGLLVCKTNNDFYRIAGESGKQLRATVNANIDDGDVDIVLYTAEGSEIASSRTTNSIEEIFVPVIIGDQDFYLEVIQLNSSFNSERSNYDLTVTMTDADPGLVCNAEFEPNDVFSDAKSLLNAAAQSAQSLGTCPNIDQDFYKVYLAAGTSIQVQFDTSSTALRATLYDPSQQFITTLFDLTSEELDFVAPFDGNYYVKVFAGAGAPRELAYGITVSNLSGFDFTPHSLAISPTTIEAGEPMLYAFTVTNQGDELSPGFDVSIELAQDAAFNSILDTFPGDSYPALDSEASVEVAGKIDIPSTLDSNRYYVRATIVPALGATELNSLNNAVSSPLDVLAVCLADLLEGPSDNDASNRAADLGGLPTSAEAGICPSDEDWFSVDLSSGEQAKVLLSFFQAEGDLDLYAYDASLNLLEQSRSVSDDENFSFNASNTGIYFIRVKGFSGNISNDYTLTID